MVRKESALPAAKTSMNFEEFLHNNRYRVNRSLNRILWVCILSGPAIALGILGGVFKHISYSACLIISAAMLVMAGTNLLVLKKKPYSFVPGLLALFGMDLLLCYMNVSHISIRLTWCLVPLLSLLFCDAKAYIGISVLNYAVMGVGTWLEAAHYAEIRTDFVTPLGAFINIFAGCTIEALLIFAAGYALGKATRNYYLRMTGQYAEAQDNQAKLEEQLDILSSMAEIYDYVNLIDFTESTEMSLREETLHKLRIEKDQNHTHMTQGLRSQIAADMLDSFWKFTDITTVPDRLVNRRIIAGEFISNKTGWFRAQYIRVRGEIDKRPDMVIYTVQSIEADKRKEEQLIRISMTDELTRVFNRRCYEEDMAAIRREGMEDDFALISADLNGLKETNDTLGHNAGDELVKGAATCLLSAVGAQGKVYRVGGDEFMAMVYTNDCAAMLDEIQRKANAWHGFLADTISLSAGCASRAEYPDADIAELEKIADQRMYAEKARYYETTGKDRRNHY